MLTLLGITSEVSLGGYGALEANEEFPLSTIVKSFPDHKNKELFYRLEQIRLLGFIIFDRPETEAAETEAEETDDCFYCLSNFYLEETKNQVSAVDVCNK
ncbi:hypothetical protein [Agarilytica rhodophyticola]|uniref:hypothetical protein n=1 Tax=Agarilytica rhodophyticola TaxID=1737490 RepID=UPI001319CA8A|nr:hypothetical protein [Agarilytica rhodophyticola]